MKSIRTNYVSIRYVKKKAERETGKKESSNEKFHLVS